MSKKSFKYLSILTFFFFMSLIMYSSNYSRNLVHYCNFKTSEQNRYEYEYINAYIDTTEREIDFKKDMLAFLHIQKTSGTFWEKSIYRSLYLNDSNNFIKACDYIERLERAFCIKNQHQKSFFWDRYLSRFCDIHADYTELKNCVMYEYNNRIKIPHFDKQFYGIIHFITILRNPIDRYISEFRHVKRGATWEKAVRVCNDELLFKKNCSNKKDWRHATWSEFLSCEHNLANNRQTRMLANYNQIGCRSHKCWTSEGNCSKEKKRIYDKRLLESAKQTLLSISFFGLAEYQSLSQYLFEKTFKDKMKFKEPLIDSNQSNYKNSEECKSLELIQKNNHLDIDLYQFAKKIFFERVAYFKNQDENNKS